MPYLDSGNVLQAFAYMSCTYAYIIKSWIDDNNGHFAVQDALNNPIRLHTKMKVIYHAQYVQILLIYASSRYISSYIFRPFLLVHWFLCCAIVAC